jgi:LuxR family maltose regulon positive regulatory protein
MSPLAIEVDSRRRSRPAGPTLATRSGSRERPPRADGIVRRAALVNRLRATRSPFVILVAPRGFGKTTVLEQWAARDHRTFVWVSGERGGGEDTSLEVDGALAFSGSEAQVIVVDDAHLLGDATLGAIAAAARSAGPDVTLVLSGRSEPHLSNPSIPLLRSRGALFELGPLDLALTPRETRAVFRLLGASPSSSALTELAEETEGWPAAVHAAAFSHGYGRLPNMCLAELTDEQRSFLRRTSVLHRMSAPLCSAVLGDPSAATELDSLSGFLVPLDHRGLWFRHRSMFTDLLRHELEQTESELVPALHTRAAVWYQEHGCAESAIDHALAAGDVARTMDLFTKTALRAYNEANDAAVELWLARVDTSEALPRSPCAAAVAARLYAHHGRTADAARCLSAANRGIDNARSPVEAAVVRARIALVEAAMGRRRVRPMLARVRSALDRLGANDPWRPYGFLLEGVAEALLGESEQADRTFSRAVRSAERLHSTETRALALTERALLADAREDHARAEAFLGQIDRPGDRVQGFPSHALTLAVSARIQLRHGGWADARRSLALAQRLLPRLTDALPWLTVQTSLELAAAHLMLRDGEAAHGFLAQADRLLELFPGTSLAAKRTQLHSDLEARLAANDPGRTAPLTRAELRLLPFLATHLSFTEIGGQFHLSRHTIKTQAISAYRKLGASNRSDAVCRAGKLGLIDTAAGSAHTPISVA